ncbi:MAG TPA: GNAT family N-acetyltransferase [Dongiaceae bacterium]|nr:GNAT family N-acetyltransferase [Dongiaceae bacterium]
MPAKRRVAPARRPAGYAIVALRKAGSPEVYAAVDALLRELEHEADEAAAIDFRKVTADWRAAGDRTRVFAARTTDGRIAGVLTLFESFAIYAGGAYGIISELYVAPAHRSSGVGKALIAAAVAHGRRRRWLRIDVTAPEDPRFDRTRRFYEREGFVFTGPKLKRLLR